MRIAILFSLLVCSHAFAAPESDHHDKKFVAAAVVENSDAGAVYGARLPASMPVAVDLDSAASNVEGHAGKLAAFSGRITEVCQKMGCWVVLTSEHGQFARVTMHDHAFGVPKDANGPAIVYGTLSKKNLSAEEIAHLKKDGADMTQPTELQIDAVSVIIPDSV
ncbi:MAG: DUF4920 domain-containing protein [Dokdonella sp.]